MRCLQIRPFRFVCPTQVGIHPGMPRSCLFKMSLPHAGGDTPIRELIPFFRSRSAPRRWGYTDSTLSDPQRDAVCPTQVGIHRTRSSIRSIQLCLPHAGGDTPVDLAASTNASVSAPRRWGYTLPCPARPSLALVCPTQVGIHRSSTAPVTVFPGLPHAGGDTPLLRFATLWKLWSAPRRWGYTFR